jgi:hypothetical protein
MGTNPQPGLGILEINFTLQTCYALPHTDQTQALDRGGLGETLAIIGNREYQASIVDLEIHPRLRCLRISSNIGQCFLSHPVQTGAYRIGWGFLQIVKMGEARNADLLVPVSTLMN